MFKSDGQSVHLSRSYADAVAAGWLLCEWYADQSGAIQMVTLWIQQRYARSCKMLQIA